ncbi:MAG: hypothetical protein ABL962_10765 [Fimbriimonadaceae bacterium]
MKTTFHTTVADKAKKEIRRLDDPPVVQVPKAFGVTIMSTDIMNNEVTFVWVFVNRTDTVVEVLWLPKSHPLDVVITDGTGKKWYINDYMPPPPDVSAPVTVQPNSESVRVFEFKPGEIPGLDLVFEPANEPYSVSLKLNSTSILFEATAGLRFSPAPPPDPLVKSAEVK